MSEIRMCDLPGCGRIFSLLHEENWTTGVISRVVRDKETGRRRTIEEQQDACGRHGGDSPEPTVAITTQATIMDPPPPAA